jgi:hypothetical protein
MNSASRTSLEGLEQRIIAARDPYFTCIRKFMDRKSDEISPNDFCIERVNSYWTRISALCNSEGCENSEEKRAWGRQHKTFTSLLGHLKDKEGIFNRELFDKDFVFGRK